MYEIIKDGTLLALKDEVVYVLKNRNNIYIPCEPVKAEGIVMGNDYVEPIEGLEVRWLDGANSIDTMLPELTDKTASGFVDLYPGMKYDGALIPYKTRINWNGVLKMAAQDLWDIEENNPDNNPLLWTDINYRDGVRVIPETFTAADAFALDELGWWKGNIYKSLLNSNVYTPEQYPNGWELQE